MRVRRTIRFALPLVRRVPMPQGLAGAFILAAALGAVVLGKEVLPVESSPPPAGEDAAPRALLADFLRFQELDGGEGRLQTAIVTYRRAGGACVDLVAAVHVGDASYFSLLEQRFRVYDRLLYEMVKPKDMVVVPGEHKGGWVSALQRGLKRSLELEFQLDAIDYRQDNFVHADLDPTTFARLQRQKGENLLTLMLKLMRAELSRQNEGRASSAVTLPQILLALSSRERSRKLKLLLARELDEVERLMAGIEGDGEESVLVAERNKAAVRALEEALAQGHEKLAIFYGAAHMPDMEERLLKLGFHREKTEWLTAWDIRRQATSASVPPGGAVAPASGEK